MTKLFGSVSLFEYKEQQQMLKISSGSEARPETSFDKVTMTKKEVRLVQELHPMLRNIIEVNFC